MNNNMKDFVKRIYSDSAASEIQKDKCVETFVNESGELMPQLHSVEIHCWEGQRYLLTKLPDGCKYDYMTGDPIQEK